VAIVAVLWRRRSHHDAATALAEEAGANEEQQRGARCDPDGLGELQAARRPLCSRIRPEGEGVQTAVKLNSYAWSCNHI
jgi:hypothetical protein